MMLPRTLAVIVVVLAFAQAGCGGEDAGAPAAATAATTKPPAAGELRPGDELPAPTGKVILRMAGLEGGSAAVDMKTLERMPQIAATVTEPFLKRNVEFSGVRVKDLLAIAGAPSAAKVIKFRALDDYHVDLTIDDLLAGDALLATKADGKRMPVAEGGPIRIVFLGDTKVANNTDNWIWSVSSIRIPAA